MLKKFLALGLGIYSINAEWVNNDGVVGEAVAADFDRPTNPNKQYSDMQLNADGGLKVEFDDDYEEWRAVVYQTPEQLNNSCECDGNKCAYWTYSNGGGYEDLQTCGSRDDAIAEAKATFEKLQAEAASDDIGQILIQIESLLVQRDGRTSGTSMACQSQAAGDASLSNGHENVCVNSQTGDIKVFALDHSEPSFEHITKDATEQLMCQCTCAPHESYRGQDIWKIAECNPNPETATIKRFKNLKAMVMSMQPDDVLVFGRYCYYGCWCLPNGQHNLAAGYGQPVDPIDEVCKEFALCYKCLDMDFAGTCNPEKRSYRWGKIRDPDTDEVIDVECKDTPSLGVVHRCKRYTCECDRILAVGLGQTHSYWNKSHHARWGGFDRETSCETDCVGCKPQDDCCGAYGSASTPFTHLTVNRRPYASTSTTSGCCQDVFYYNMLSQECCIDGSTVTVTDAGTCPGSTIDPDQIDDFNENYPGYTRK